MRIKIFKTLDEQIEILKRKNLVINDIDKAKQILFRENYFFLNGYRHVFMNENETFIKGTKFEELYGLFIFDRKIRNIFFKYIMIVENNLKSIFSYHLSKKYGFKEKDYLNHKNFNNDELKEKQVIDVLNKMKRQIRVNGTKHSATMHYISNYGYIPLWVSVKVLSFGIISELFNILKYEDQINIADTYNIKANEMSIFLAVLANFRNLCAHEDILYDHKAARSINNNKYHYELDIEKDEEGIFKFGKNDLFALVIILKYLLTKEEGTDLVYEIGYEIDVLEGKINVVEINKILAKIGFPINWRDIEKI
jgi:abortive infection bacteriophage resistance protein